MARTQHALTTDSKSGPWNRRVHNHAPDSAALVYDRYCPACVDERRKQLWEEDELPTSAERHDTHEDPAHYAS